jgi:hypothetical protein
MKVRATIEVGFELDEGQPEHAARAALLRGLGDLRHGIEFGSGGIPTGVKRGSIKAEIVNEHVAGDENARSGTWVVGQTTGSPAAGGSGAN